MKIQTMNRKLWEYADELYKLSSKAVQEKKVKLKFSILSGEVMCRVILNEEIYEIYTDPALWRNAVINYRQCRKKLLGILEPEIIFEEGIKIEDRNVG